MTLKNEVQKLPKKPQIQSCITQKECAYNGKSAYYEWAKDFMKSGVRKNREFCILSHQMLKNQILSCRVR